MPFDVLIHITEDSRRGQVIRKIADQQHTTPEQVIERIIDEAIEDETGLGEKSPKNRAGHSGPRGTVRMEGGDEVFGMFAHVDGFVESIEAVIAGRGQRYGDKP